MSVEQLALVLHHSAAKGTDKLVLIGIANHDGDGGAWPSIATLARYANVTERNVQKAIARLVAAGELLVELNRGGDAERPDWERPNRYHVTVTCPVACDRSARHKLRPLPTAQAELWTNPLSGATPPVGSDTRPPSRATPRPPSQATPEPSLEPSSNSGLGSAYVQTARGSGDTPPCTECSAPSLDACHSRQAKLRPADRHTYTPRPSS